MIYFLQYIQFYKIKISHWLYSKKIHSLKFTSILPLENVPGHNKKFIAIDNNGKKWLLKLCDTGGKILDYMFKQKPAQ